MSFEDKNGFNQRIINILENFNDAFFEVDLDWTVIYWNKACEKLVSKSSEEVLGKNLWNEFSEAKSLKFYTEYHRAIRENVSVRFEEYWQVKKNGLRLRLFLPERGYPFVLKILLPGKRLPGNWKRKEKDITICLIRVLCRNGFMILKH